MSKAVQYLGILYNNPFVLGHVLYSFYNALSDKDRSVLLSYLVFPLSLYPSSQKYLIQRRNSQSCLRILAKEHDRLFGLEDRIQEYKHITDVTLQYGIDIGVISINPELKVEILKKWPDEFISPPNASEAAQRLGEFMSKYDVPTSYRMLGVKAL
ncbi:MAG: hypothetical protein KAT56_08950 [Sedimentisphaerales bacterium]|nr:hypothetical protein [Sedimentisphaerales bacterium]